jgi:hypothetical protein
MHETQDQQLAKVARLMGVPLDQQLRALQDNAAKATALAAIRSSPSVSAMYDQVTKLAHVMGVCPDALVAALPTAALAGGRAQLAVPAQAAVTASHAEVSLPLYVQERLKQMAYKPPSGHPDVIELMSGVRVPIA